MLFPGALGDAVCVEPVVAWLARTGPVELLARGAAAEVAALFPARPLVSSLDRVEVARLFAPRTAADRGDRWLDRYARVVSFTGARSDGVRARLGARAGAILAAFPRRTGTTHAIDEMLVAVAGEEAAAVDAVPTLVLPRPVGRVPGRMVLHPGAGASAKRPPVALLRELADRWRRAPGTSVEVLLGPAEAGEEASWRGLGVVARPGGVEELAGRIAAADVYVGGDTGPSHVAAALGAHAVVVFVATSPRRFGPRGPGVRALDFREPGSGDGLETAWAALASQLP